MEIMCSYLVMYYSNFLKFELYIKYTIKLFTLNIYGYIPISWKLTKYVIVVY